MPAAPSPQGVVSVHAVFSTSDDADSSLLRRDLSSSNKQGYINAVKCLQSARASNRTLPSKFNRFDEYVIHHTLVADTIHGVVCSDSSYQVLFV